MYGAYSNIKSRIFPSSGGGKESPFLEELRDESVAREMEEWNFSHTDDDSALDTTGPIMERYRRNFHERPRDQQNRDEAPFRQNKNSNNHSHARQENPYANHGATTCTYILKIVILMLSVATIMCIMASTETITGHGGGCERPKSVQYPLVILFFSIVVNVCVLTLCERFIMCCTIGRMEFFYQFLATILLGVAIFVYGAWLYSVGMPTDDFPLPIPTASKSAETTTASTQVKTSFRENEISGELVKSMESLPIMPIPTKVSAEPPTTTNSSAANTTHADLKQAKRQLIALKEKPLIPHSTTSPKIQGGERDPCADVKLPHSQFYLAVTSIFLLFVIVSAHCGILTLYCMPCMGLMHRDNEARILLRAAHNRVHQQQQQQQHHHHRRPSPQKGIEMRDRRTNANNSNDEGSVAETNRRPLFSNENETNKMSTKPLILRKAEERFTTSSPSVTPTKNRSLLQKVAHSQLWGATKRGVDVKDDKLDDSIVSADQLLETTIDDSDANVSTVAVVEVNTTGGTDGDDVLFDAHDSALLNVIAKKGLDEDPS